MEHKVTGKQFITEMCFGCGKDNDDGLKGQFYNLEDGSIVAVFQPGEHFQSYPLRLHGGVTASILDETLGRAILAIEPSCWAVTAELAIRYKKPIPLGVPLKVTAKVTENSRKLFRSSGEVILPDGEVAAMATGSYIKMTLDQITDTTKVDLGSAIHEQDSDLESIEY